MSHKSSGYTSDLKDKQWVIIENLLSRKGGAGRPMQLPLREVINAILYVVRTGCRWRELPKEYPKWQSVYYHYRKWCQDGTWRWLSRALLYEQRRKQGRRPHPSAGVMDSQSVKTTESGGERRYDAWKHVKGRKRHLLVDTQGQLIDVRVTAANRLDQDGARAVFQQLSPMTAQRLQRVWADRAYRGAWTTWLADEYGIHFEVVETPPGQKGFQVLPRRWVVERTFAWLGRYRRLSKDYERCIAMNEGLILIAASHVLLKRLAA